jgi:lipid-A-disaccharide synthase
MTRIFLVAGEPSGDRLGAALMAGLKTLDPGVSFEGIGGPLMMAEGMQSRFDMSELSVMGIAEVLPKYRHLKRRIAETAAAVVEAKPDALVTIDAPDFSLRVARLVKEASDIRTVHYVAPTVWAWRPGRAAKMAKSVDQVLALFPFEPPLMQAAGMECSFVGHPVVAEPVARKADVAAFRDRHDLGDTPYVLVLPGSRRAEVARLGDVFGETMERLLLRHPGLRIVVPAAASVADQVRATVRDWPGDPVVLDPAAPGAAATKHEAFRGADVALAASGTVSLELAAAGTPMVIAYRMHWLSFRLIRAMAIIDTVTLVNIVSDSRVVPEFLGPACRPDPIARALDAVLREPTAQRDAMNLTMDRLGRGGEDPGLRAARAVLDGIRPKN